MSLGWVAPWHTVAPACLMAGFGSAEGGPCVVCPTVSHLPQVWVTFRRACGGARVERSRGAGAKGFPGMGEASSCQAVPCRSWWHGWIWPLGPEERRWPRSKALCPQPRDPWGRWDRSTLALGTAQCHQNSSPAACALQLQTRGEELVPGAGKMLRSLDPALLFPQQPTSSSPALVAAASLGAS